MDAADERWPLARGGVPIRPPLRTLMQPTEGERGHVLFVATAAGYEIRECDDAPPQPGQLVLLPSGYYRVSGVRRSPFPGDPRPCFTVEPS